MKFDKFLEVIPHQLIKEPNNYLLNDKKTAYTLNIVDIIWWEII